MTTIQNYANKPIAELSDTVLIQEAGGGDYRHEVLSALLTLFSATPAAASVTTLDASGDATFGGNVTQERTTGDAGLTVKTNGANQSAYITLVGQNAGDSDISLVSEGAGLGSGFSIRRGGFTGTELFNIERASGNATFNGAIRAAGAFPGHPSGLSLGTIFWDATGGLVLSGDEGSSGDTHRFTNKTGGTTLSLSQTGNATFGGDIMYPNNKSIEARNAANTANRSILTRNANDQTVIRGGPDIIFQTNDEGAVATALVLDDNQNATFTNAVATGGTIAPLLDANFSNGTASLRWTTIYATTGTINTSDAREKTEVVWLTPDELQASKLLGKEIGTYKWLSAIEAKGDEARKHIGITVQRAIEIMESCGLAPFEYGFICYDEWEDEFVEHEAVEATESSEAVEAWTEQVQWAGSRYGFRYAELLAFIAAGINARIEALENA